MAAGPTAYGENWFAATRVESAARPRLAVELDVDVCIIGAGLAGLTAAREIARLGWSVAVLEAQSIGWGASGRNAGVVLPGFGSGMDALIERVGLDHAKALWARSEAGAEYVRNAARDMPGVALSENGWLHVSQTDDTRAMAHEAALMAGEFGTAVHPWPADRVQAALQSPRYFHGLYYPRGFCLHPLHYALGLAAAAEAAGARIFENTPVLEIDPAGVRKRVVTQHSRVRAAHLVLAGNVHMAELVPHLANTLLTVFTTTVVTAPLGDELYDAIGFAGAVADSDVAGHHHRIAEGGRLIWSGQSSISPGPPQGYADALVRRIRGTYPGLRDVKAEHAWIGAAGHTVHGMPQIGEVVPGLWLLNGFGGHGLNTTAMAGEIVARGIVDGDRSWEMFSPFALVWAGGAFGRAAWRLSDWSRRTRQTWQGMLAGRRDGRLRPAGPPASVVPPAPAGLAGELSPQTPEHQPAVAPPPAPDKPAATPSGSKRPKRGPKKNKARAAQATLSSLSGQVTDRDHRPADAAMPAEPPDGAKPPPPGPKA
jgi:gamma-glutamylputrescine oxidase